MSDDEPHFTSLKDRIAALNLQNGGAPPTPAPPGKRTAPAAAAAPKPQPQPKPTVAPKPALAPKPIVTAKPAIAPKPKPSPSPVSAVSSASTSSWAKPTPSASASKPIPPASWKQAPAPVPDPTPSWVKPSPSSSPKPTGVVQPTLPSRPELPQRRPSDAPISAETARSPVEASARPPPPLPGRGAARPPLPARKPSADVGQPEARTLPPRAGGDGVTPGRLKPELLNGFKHHHDEKEEQSAEQPPVPAARPRPPLPAGKPGLPPRLPSRHEDDEPAPSSKSPPIPEARPEPAPLPKRTLPPTVPRAPSPPPIPKPAEPAELNRGGPPPIPLNSRPPPVPLNSRPKPVAAPTPAPLPAAAPAFDDGPIDMPPVHCLVCRDYTAPDAVAAQYPRANLPHDPVGYLAEVLCGPFEYLTDKARAIFTWCHHNISYDAANFLAGTVPRGHTAEDTIRYGKGVCDGYSKVYHSIAERAGLECVIIQGHGKGYNYAPPPPGVVPPRDSNHAWNAVRLDDGTWKLVDACWGAGHIDNGVFKPIFDAPQFTMSNEAFARRHHPNEEQYQFRADPLSWEEYVEGPVGGLPQPTWFTSAKAEGLDETALEPAVRDIDPRDYAGGSIRFQVPWMCEHWGEVLERRGGALLLMLHVGGEYQPLEYNGEWWWIDVPASTIRPDDSLMLVGLDQMGGESARGMTKDEFLSKKGRMGYSFIGMAKWEVV